MHVSVKLSGAVATVATARATRRWRWVGYWSLEEARKFCRKLSTGPCHFYPDLKDGLSRLAHRSSALVKSGMARSYPTRQLASVSQLDSGHRARITPLNLGCCMLHAEPPSFPLLLFPFYVALEYPD